MSTQQVTLTGSLSVANSAAQVAITVVEGGPERFMLIRLDDKEDGSVEVKFNGSCVTPGQIPKMLRELADGFEKNVSD